MLQLLLCVDRDDDGAKKKSLPLNNKKKVAYKLDDWMAKCFNDSLTLTFLNGMAMLTS